MQHQTLVSISYLLLLGGLIAPLSFHERLAVITKTLSAGATDLFHFFIVFMVRGLRVVVLQQWV